MKEMMSKMMNGESSTHGDAHDKAKLEVLEELRDMAMSMMGDKVKSKLSPLEEMKKVTVAAPDQEGLEEGLEAAQELVPEIESEEDEDMSVEELDAMIRDLEEQKRAKLMKA